MALIVIEVVTSLEGQVGQQDLHVVDGADGHADPSDLPGGQRRIRVIAHLRGQVEGDRQAGLPLLEQVAEALVGLGRAGEAGVLAHRPEAAAVHRRLDAAREGELARAARGRRPRRVSPCPPACRGLPTSMSDVVRNVRAAQAAPSRARARVVSRQRSRPGSAAIPTSL